MDHVGNLNMRPTLGSDTESLDPSGHFFRRNISRPPNDQINTRILQGMISGVPPIWGLTSRDVRSLCLHSLVPH